MLLNREYSSTEGHVNDKLKRHVSSMQCNSS